MTRSRIKSMQFDGDIIITDPCYITEDDDWEKSDYGSHMDGIGLHKCITNETIYGDWGCTTYEVGTDKTLGKFCADAGMVGVFDLAEVLEYNPKFDYHITKPWTTTLIKNFQGEVYIEETRTKDDTYIRIIGEGIDKTTGYRLHFFTEQTEL